LVQQSILLGFQQYYLQSFFLTVKSKVLAQQLVSEAGSSPGNLWKCMESRKIGVQLPVPLLSIGSHPANKWLGEGQ